MTQKTATVVLKYSTDQSTIQTAILANTKVLDSLQTVGDQAQTVADQLKALGVSLDDVTVGGDKITAGLTTPLDSANTSAQAFVATIHDIGLQLNALPEPDLSAFGVNDKVGNSNGGFTPSALTTAGRLVGGPGGHVLRAAGQASRLADMLPEDSNALLQLGAAGLIAAPALIAAKIALDNFNKTIEDSKKQLAGALSAETDYYHALQTFTSKQADDQIATLQRTTPYLQQQSTELQNAINSAFKQLQDQFGDVGARALIASGNSPTKQLQDQLDNVNSQITENVGYEARLEQARKSGAFATNDAADAEQKLADERKRQQQANKGYIDDTANTQTQLSALRRTGTTDQVNAELDANRDRQTIIQSYLIPNYKLLGLSLSSLRAEFGKLTTVDNELVQSVLPVVSAREAEKKLLDDRKAQSDALNSVLQDISKAQVSLAAASQKTADALTAVGQAETDHRANLITIQQTYDAAQRDALSKKNSTLAKIDQQAAERQLQQRENDNLSIVQAVARGDLASAQATLAQQKVKDAQDQRQIQQQKADVRQNYTDQLAAAKTQNTKLLASEQERYTKELAQRREAYNKAYQDEQAQNARLQSLRDQQTAIERYWISTTVVDMYKITDATNALSVSAQSYADRVNADIQARTVSGQSGGSAGGATIGSGSGVRETIGGSGTPFPTRGGSSRTITQYALGTDYVPRDMLAFIHKGEAIIPAGQNRGSTMIFQVSDADLAAKIVAAVKPVVEAHGEKVKVEVVQSLTAIHQGQKR